MFRLLLCVLTLASGLLLAQETTVSFRVRLGVTDTAARAWDGELTVRGGEVLQLRNWRPRPEQEIISKSRWRLATEDGINFRLRPWEKPRSQQPYLLVPGLIVDMKGTDATSLHFETANGSFDVEPFALTPGKAVPLLDGAVLVDLVPTVEAISTPDFQNDFATMLAGPDGELWTAWVAYAGGGNQVRVRRYNGSAWGEIETISEDHNDIFLVKAARDGEGSVWFVWSSQVDGNFDLYGRKLTDGKWSPIERLTEAPEPDVYHAMAADSKGKLWLTWQGFRQRNSSIFVRSYDEDEWSTEEQISFSGTNDWEPAVATDSRGRAYVAWDTYNKGNYDVVLSRYSKGEWSEREVIADTPKFEAHVSLACDAKNRLWAAWNESGVDWGKDTGFLLERQGTRLYESRSMAVAVFADGQWQDPETDIATSLPEEFRGYNDLPILQPDTWGRIWLLFRHRRPRIVDTPSDTPMHRAGWEIFATTYGGNYWTPPIALPFSVGRTDMRIGVAADDDGNVYAAWPTDNRNFEGFLYQQADIHTARLPSFGRRKLAEPRFEKRDPPDDDEAEDQNDAAPLHRNEASQVSRLRGYRIESGDKTYRIHRGDTHRHSEFSFDGHNDGSLVDIYRYALDVADLDYLMVSDHNNAAGPDVEYVNWLLQQMCDVVMLPRRFLPLYGYERSISYPDGHRNVIFAERGNPTLPITTDERQHKTGAAALFEYLKKYNGISIPHTSTTGMGTDWRDNDPEVEPLVEIYQGDRISAEHEGAPKAAVADDPSTAPGGYRPAGFVWNAWAKGYKLGVQAASDHLSTHISYACTIAEEFSREGLLDAMKKRHSYGATDNIILDYRLLDGDREYLQGDIMTAGRRFKLSVKVLGTAPVSRVDIIKNNTFLHTVEPKTADVEFTYADADAKSGESYYYVRVQQSDGQMAWSSPIWVTIR